MSQTVNQRGNKSDRPAWARVPLSWGWSATNHSEVTCLSLGPRGASCSDSRPLENQRNGGAAPLLREPSAWWVRTAGPLGHLCFPAGGESGHGWQPGWAAGTGPHVQSLRASEQGQVGGESSPLCEAWSVSEERLSVLLTPRPVLTEDPTGSKVRARVHGSRCARPAVEAVLGESGVREGRSCPGSEGRAPAAGGRAREVPRARPWAPQERGAEGVPWRCRRSWARHGRRQGTGSAGVPPPRSHLLPCGKPGCSCLWVNGKPRFSWETAYLKKKDHE